MGWRETLIFIKMTKSKTDVFMKGKWSVPQKLHNMGDMVDIYVLGGLVMMACFETTTTQEKANSSTTTELLLRVSGN